MSKRVADKPLSRTGRRAKAVEVAVEAKQVAAADSDGGVYSEQGQPHVAAPPADDGAARMTPAVTAHFIKWASTPVTATEEAQTHLRCLRFVQRRRNGSLNGKELPTLIGHVRFSATAKKAEDGDSKDIIPRTYVHITATTETGLALLAGIVTPPARLDCVSPIHFAGNFENPEVAENIRCTSARSAKVVLAVTRADGADGMLPRELAQEIDLAVKVVRSLQREVVVPVVAAAVDVKVDEILRIIDEKVSSQITSAAIAEPGKISFRVALPLSKSVQVPSRVATMEEMRMREDACESVKESWSIYNADPVFFGMNDPDTKIGELVRKMSSSGHKPEPGGKYAHSGEYVPIEIRMPGYIAIARDF